MSQQTLLPWSQIIAFGLGEMRLAPESFWSMTLRELDFAVSGISANTQRLHPLERRQFDSLMHQFPD